MYLRNQINLMLLRHTELALKSSCWVSYNELVLNIVKEMNM